MALRSGKAADGFFAICLVPRFAIPHPLPGQTSLPAVRELLALQPGATAQVWLARAIAWRLIAGAKSRQTRFGCLYD